jgi:hypothetical protein
VAANQNSPLNMCGQSKLTAEYVAANQNSPLNMLQCVKSRRLVLQQPVT